MKSRVPLYVVTGINRLKGEREAVTRPHGLTKTCEMRDKLVARQHCRSAYSRLKVKSALEDNIWWAASRLGGGKTASLIMSFVVRLQKFTFAVGKS